METNVSRRDFLKGSIVVALGAAGAATLSSCAGGDAAAKADSAVATAPDTAWADRKSTRLNSSHLKLSRMPSSA